VKIPLICTLVLCSFTGALDSQELSQQVEHALQFSETQLAETVSQLGDTTVYPYRTIEDTVWYTRSAGSWVTGWFPGCLWQMYDRTLDETWRRWAESWTAGLEDSKYKTNTHDVGFIIFCSFGNGYRLTGREDYKDVIIQAARSFATRYHPRVGCFRSWNSYRFPVIIDNMANLEILFWASRNGGEPEWYDMAVSHALRTSEDHIRPDGGTYQIVDYDTTTGDYYTRTTKQGASAESTWSRGQAWGLYGFVMAYRETGDLRFLETACTLADYFVDNLPDDYVPYWDFQASDIPDEEKDVSAAAIAVSGLIELSTMVTESRARQKYQLAVSNILTSLCSPSYLAEGTNGCGILMHGVQNHNAGKGIDESSIYADYYFIEALLRYQDMVTSTITFGEPPFSLPGSVRLFQNYPNPFNPDTNLRYWLSVPGIVSLNLYDLNGGWIRTVEQGFRDQGHHQYRLLGHELASGIYLAVLEVAGVTKTRKITLVQ
jgi:hypothetical protein